LSPIDKEINSRKQKLEEKKQENKVMENLDID